MQRITRPTLTAMRAAPVVQQRGFAKATLIGRLGATPEVRKTANGKEYIRYTLAVNRPPKRDESGEIAKGEDGYPIRETDWFNLFCFRPSSVEGMPRLPAGTQLAVEAVLETRSNPEGLKDIMLRDVSHKVVAFVKKE